MPEKVSEPEPSSENIEVDYEKMSEAELGDYMRSLGMRFASIDSRNRQNYHRRIRGIGPITSRQGSLIFLQIQSKHRQVISSKFPKTFRGTRDFMACYELFFAIFRGVLDFQKFTDHHQVTSTPKSLRKLA